MQKSEKDEGDIIAAENGLIISLFLETVCVCATVQLLSEGGAGFGLTIVGLLAFTGLFLFLVVFNVRKLDYAIKKKRQKQLDQQKTDQAAD